MFNYIFADDFIFSIWLDQDLVEATWGFLDIFVVILG